MTRLNSFRRALVTGLMGTGASVVINRKAAFAELQRLILPSKFRKIGCAGQRFRSDNRAAGG